MSDSVPDGGERHLPSSPAGEASPAELESPTSSTWTLLAFVLVGNGAGLFLGVVTGVGPVGSLPTFVLSLVGGAVAAALGRPWWSADEDRDAGNPSARAGDESSPGEPSTTARWTGDADVTNLAALGASVSAASDDFQVEIDDGVLKIRKTDRS